MEVDANVNRLNVKSFGGMEEMQLKTKKVLDVSQWNGENL